MIRQILSRGVFARASASVSVSNSSSLCVSSSSFATSQPCLYNHPTLSSFRSFSSSPPAPSSSSSSSSSSPSPSSSSSKSDVPANFYENPDGENLSLYSEESTFTGHSRYLIPGPFGTMEKPAVIYSDNDSRIVGCEGGDGLPHPTSWFQLRTGPKHVCSDCGQVFLLQTPPANSDAFVSSWTSLQGGNDHDAHGHDGSKGSAHH